MANIKMFIVLLLILFNNNIYTQNLFTSKNGKVLISFKYFDTALTAVDNKALIKLDYAAAQIDLMVDSKNIKTGIDSLDNMLTESDKTLHLIANLDLDYIDTKKHPKQIFTFNGTLYQYSKNSFQKKKIVSINGKGNLEHISESDNLPACILTLNFELQPKNLKTSYPYNLMEEYIKVEVIQTILRSN